MQGDRRHLRTMWLLPFAAAVQFASSACLPACLMAATVMPTGCCVVHLLTNRNRPRSATLTSKTTPQMYALGLAGKASWSSSKRETTGL